MVSSLTGHVSKRMHEESQVQKEKRKLREAKGGGKNKGGGKVDGNPQRQMRGGGKKQRAGGAGVAGFLKIIPCLRPVLGRFFGGRPKVVFGTLKTKVSGAVQR